ncbi:glycosyl hydrolase family 18 protein [Nocardioides sp. Soil805]|uniref:glycosyl hydrolase family 18 protein n=1 Tax=Nocardioides sp. Soil805 TaxID=1736416 RepID=UPI001F1CF14F|nr:glycoside hydrolase family 18 protein [Nocardioides sp. Soil805]
MVALIAVVLAPPLAAMTQSSGASAPPQRTAQVAVRVKVPTRVASVIGDSRTVRRVRRLTQLQRLGSQGWRTESRARSRRSGRVAYHPRPVSGPTPYRVRAPRTAVRIAAMVDGRRVLKVVRLRAWISPVQVLMPVGTDAPTASPTPTPSQTPTTTPTQHPTQQPQGSPWVTGYYAGWFWEVGDMLAPEDVDMSAMTHFVFGRVAPGGGSLEGEPDDLNYPGYPYVPGDLVPGAGSGHRSGRAPDGSGRSVEDYLVDRAHDTGAEALLMLGGDGLDGRGFMLSTDDAVRPRFVENVVDYLVQHDYDGIDLDWENCLSGDAGCGEAAGQAPVAATEARRRLMALIADLRAEAATRERFAGDPLLVTFPGYPLNLNYQLEDGKAPQWQADIANAVDQYNLMSYGIGTTYNGAEWDSWFSGALTGATATHPVDIASSIDAYVAAGVPRDRIGLGIGFYGIYWGPDVTGPRQNTNSNDIWETKDDDLAYGALDRMGYLTHGTRHWDAEAQSTYRTYEQYGASGYVPPTNPQHPLDDDRLPAGFLSYEDEQSIQAKGDWVKETGAGGTIIWTLNYGWVPRSQSNPLLDAVKRAFLS